MQGTCMPGTSSTQHDHPITLDDPHREFEIFNSKLWRLILGTNLVSIS